MYKQLLGNHVLREFLVYSHQKYLGFDVHVSNVHPTFMMEQHMTAFLAGVYTYIKLLFLWER